MGGSSPTGIMIDTAAMPLDMPLGPNTMLVVRIPKGVANPPTCLNAAKWVWTVKTYSAQSTLLDFTVANPATDLCVGAPVRVGVPDPAFLKTAHWLNVRPTMSVVYETIKVYFYGFRCPPSARLALHTRSLALGGGCTVRCARAVRKVGYFGPVSPDGEGDCGHYCVPMHRTAQILTQSKNPESRY